MEFDLKKFKENYGGPVIKLLYWEAAILILSMVLRITAPSTLTTLLQWISALMAMVILPLTFCYYIDIKKKAKRQKQWVSGGKLYIERSLEFGLAGGGFVDHKATITIEQMEDAVLEKRWILLQGNIKITDFYNGTIKEKAVKQYRIPRSFTNEEEILKIASIRNKE